MSVLVNGMIAFRDKQPYLQIDIDGHVVQVTMAQARHVARLIEALCARTEADAMIYRFFNKMEYPKGAADALMIEFRNFRETLDREVVEERSFDPDDPSQGQL